MICRLSSTSQQALLEHMTDLLCYLMDKVDLRTLVCKDKGSIQTEYKLRGLGLAYSLSDSVNISDCARATGNHGSPLLAVETLVHVARVLVLGRSPS